MQFRSIVLTASLILGTVGLHAQASPTQIALQPYLSGLSAPVFMTSAYDGTGRLFIVQQGGTIKVVQPGSTTPTTFLDITSRVLFGGERGLLGLAFHPQYSTNGRFFVYYSRAGATSDPLRGAIQIAEYHVSSDPNVASTTETILITIPHPTNTNHNGGTVVFGPDGYLYAGTGDGGSANDPPNNAQNINVLLGKILRFDINNVPVGQVPAYNIPPTNPYAGSIPGADEIYQIGMRNPYRFSFDNARSSTRGGSVRTTTRMWIADVGQGAIEEVDNGKLGGNFGWRAYEGTTCTNLNTSQCTTNPPVNTLVQVPPVFQYTHSMNNRCAIIGGFVYRSRLRTFPAGAYVYGDYCSGEIFMWANNTQTVLLSSGLGIVGFGRDDAGEIYVIADNNTIQKIGGQAPRIFGEGSATRGAAARRR